MLPLLSVDFLTPPAYRNKNCVIVLIRLLSSPDLDSSLPREHRPVPRASSWQAPARPTCAASCRACARPRILRRAQRPAACTTDIAPVIRGLRICRWPILEVFASRGLPPVERYRHEPEPGQSPDLGENLPWWSERFYSHLGRWTYARHYLNRLVAPSPPAASPSRFCRSPVLPSSAAICSSKSWPSSRTAIGNPEIIVRMASANLFTWPVPVPPNFMFGKVTAQRIDQLCSLPTRRSRVRTAWLAPAALRPSADEAHRQPMPPPRSLERPPYHSSAASRTALRRWEE